VATRYDPALPGAVCTGEKHLLVSGLDRVIRLFDGNTRRDGGSTVLRSPHADRMASAASGNDGRQNREVGHGYLLL